MNQPIIEIQNLTKIYQGDVGVKDISFKVYEGEIFGFLGPNGAGKSTAIKMMLDVTRPDSGTVRIFGKEVTHHSIYIRSNCGYLPGDFQAFQGLTGEDFLKISSQLKQHDNHRSNYDVNSLLDRFQLPKVALQKKVKAYSHGMKQKLGLINAITSKPKLLILDEPSIGLDPIIQNSLYDLLRELAADGTTILFSSHNLPEVERICDRVAVIRQGKLVIVSSLEELKKRSFRKLILTTNQSMERVTLEGCSLLQVSGNNYTYLVEKDMNTVIASLSDIDIERIVIPEPSLDEIFKSFYEGN